MDQDWQNHQLIREKTPPSCEAQRTFEKASCGQRLGNLMGGTDFDDEFPEILLMVQKSGEETSWVQDSYMQSSNSFMCVHTLRARPIFRGHLFFFRECQLEGIISSKGRTIPKPMLFFLFYFQIQRQIATSVQVDRGFFSHLRRRVRSKYMIKSSVIFRILHSQHIIICI